jgi:hypothetical protein
MIAAEVMEYETRLSYILPRYKGPAICVHDLAFAAEMRAAFEPLRLVQSRSAGPPAHECAAPTTGVEGDA